MTVKSLWGEISPEIDVKPPKIILSEQASAITELTKGVLSGHVYEGSTKMYANSSSSSFPSSYHSDARDAFEYSLEIHAPALNNYSITIVSVSHGIDIYPVFLQNQVTRDPVNAGVLCNDEAELLAKLEHILNSPEVHRIVSSLLALSKA